MLVAPAPVKLDAPVSTSMSIIFYVQGEVDNPLIWGV